MTSPAPTSIVAPAPDDVDATPITRSPADTTAAVTASAAFSTASAVTTAPSSTTAPSTTTAPSVGTASLVLAGATLAASASNYLVNLVLARWMAPSEFGDANLIVTLMLGITAVAVTLQLVSARRISTADAVSAGTIRSGLLRRAWWTGAGVAAATTAAAPVLRDVTSSASALPFVLLAVGLPCYLAQAVERGVLQGRLRFGGLALTLIVEAAVRSIVAIGLVALGLGVSGATIGITASFALTWLVARRRSSAEIDATASARSHHLDPVDERSPLAPATAADTLDAARTDRLATQAAALLLVGQIIVNNGDVVLAKVLLSPTDAGIFSVVALVGRAVFFLSWSIVTAAFPHAAREGDANARLVERRAVRTIALLGAAMTALVTVAAPPLTPIVFGSDYERAAPLFAPYALATSLFAVANVRATLGAARGRRAGASIVIGGGVGQAVLLVALADDLATMAWLQVVAMAALCLAVTLGARPAASDASPASGHSPLRRRRRQDCSA